MTSVAAVHAVWRAAGPIHTDTLKRSRPSYGTMLTYEKAIRSPKTFQAITGMTRPQFDLLYADVEKKYDEAEATRLSKRHRKRSIGAGRRFALSLQNRLLLLLFHYIHPDRLRDGDQRGPSHRVKGHIVS